MPASELQSSALPRGLRPARGKPGTRSIQSPEPHSVCPRNRRPNRGEVSRCAGFRKRDRSLFPYPSIARAWMKSESSTFRLRLRARASPWSMSPIPRDWALNYVHVLLAGTARTIGPRCAKKLHAHKSKTAATDAFHPQRRLTESTAWVFRRRLWARATNYSASDSSPVSSERPPTYWMRASSSYPGIASSAGSITGSSTTSSPAILTRR